MWESAIRSVVGPNGVDDYNRTEWKMVKHDVVGYLCKYLTKGADLDRIDWTDWQGCVPTQWVYVSGDLRKRVKLYSLPLQGVFGAWLGLNAKQLRQKLLCTVHDFAPDDMPVGRLRHVQFMNVKAVGICLAQFEKDRRRLIEHLVGGDPGDSAEYKFDPALHAGLPVPAVDLESYNLSTTPVLDSGRTPDQFRETFERLFREVDIPEPVFVGVTDLPVEGSRQTELFRGGTLLTEVH